MASIGGIFLFVSALKSDKHPWCPYMELQRISSLRDVSSAEHNAPMSLEWQVLSIFLTKIVPKSKLSFKSFDYFVRDMQNAALILCSRKAEEELNAYIDTSYW